MYCGINKIKNQHLTKENVSLIYYNYYNWSPFCKDTEIKIYEKKNNLWDV